MSRTCVSINGPTARVRSPFVLVGDIVFSGLFGAVEVRSIDRSTPGLTRAVLGFGSATNRIPAEWLDCEWVALV